MSAKRKILFANLFMPFGGVERALLDVLSIIPQDRFDVTLLLRDQVGGFLPEVPAWVHVRELPLLPMDRYELQHGRGPTLRHAVLTGHWGHAFGMLWMRVQWVLLGRKTNYDALVTATMVRRMPRMSEDYFDVAIAYSGDSILIAQVVLSYIRASRRYCWSHSERPAFQMDLELFAKYYSRFDEMFACSKATTVRINTALHRNAVRHFPHLLNTERMRKLASEGSGLGEKHPVPVVLTVGRLCDQKGIDIAIRVHRHLLDAGCRHQWVVIGEGEDEQKLREEIVLEGIADTFRLAGGMQNPYSYFATCDIYVQPSRYEGYCLTVAEARAFCKPIVCTDFDGAREQLKDGITGLIVPMHDEEGFYLALKKLLLDKTLCCTLARNLSREQVDTRQSVSRRWSDLLS